MYSDDLDDGEIAPHHPGRRRSPRSYSRDRQYYSGDPRSRDPYGPRSYRDSDRADRSPRYGRESPVYDRHYSRDRSPPRHRSHKVPSVHDAVTRADLGRLEREREAAAYKAKVLAAAKASASPAPAAAKVEPEQKVVRERSRTPSRTEEKEPSKTTDLKASETPTTKRPELARNVSSRSAVSASYTSKPLSQADISRLEREKEAALYKARTAQLQKAASEAAQRKPSTPVLHSAVSAPVSASEAEAPVAKTSAQETEVVRKLISLTPEIDLELAALNEEYEALCEADSRIQTALRSSLRKWLKGEDEVKREAYKSELAEQSLTTAASF